MLSRPRGWGLQTFSTARPSVCPNPIPGQDTGTAELHPAARAVGISPDTASLLFPCDLSANLLSLLPKPWSGRDRLSLSHGGGNCEPERKVNIHGEVSVQLSTRRSPPTAAGPADCVFRYMMPRLSDLPDKDISNERGNWLYIHSVSVSPSVTWG